MRYKQKVILLCEGSGCKTEIGTFLIVKQDEPRS